MGVVVPFNYQTFTTSYPEFAQVNEPQIAGYWQIATMMHANDGSGPINDPAMQTSFLNMLAAHVAWLFAARDSQGNPSTFGTGVAPALNGRIQSATEGSVSVSVEALQGFNTAQASWLSQTKYGMMYWASTAFIRTARYIPPRCTGPVPFFATPIRFR